MKASDTSYFIGIDEQIEHVSDHIWLFYLSRQKSYPENWQFESNQDEVSFEPKGLGSEVKRCGVHPIYMHEGSMVWNLDEFHQVLDVAKTSKRSFKDYSG